MKRDREKWNARYTGRDVDFPAADTFLMEHRHFLAAGRALDLACGMGADSIFLARTVTLSMLLTSVSLRFHDYIVRLSDSASTFGPQSWTWIIFPSRVGYTT